VRQGHEVTVLNRVTDAPTDDDANYAVRRFSYLNGSVRFGLHRPPFSWFAARQIRRFLEETKPDLVSAHFGYPVALWLASMRDLPPFLITCHGPALNETPQGPRQRYGLGPRLAAAMNRSVGAVAISSDAHRIMLKIGVDPDRILDIPNGVDRERYRRRVDGFDLRSLLGLPPDALVVLSVGRDVWAKAYDVGIRAFALAAESSPRARYVIVGRDTSRQQPLADELGVGDRVAFHEGLYGDDLIAAYQQADVFLMPSVKELCPLVVPEAMAAGLPEVVTAISGSEDMVHDGRNGFVVEPGKVEPLAEALSRLLRDDDLRKTLAHGSVEESEKYSWDRISRAYLAGAASTAAGRENGDGSP
jgi:glycosyltransferase involved in cell wall biosynthesis